MSDPSRPARRFLRAAGISAWVLSGIPAVLMVLGRFGIDGEMLTLSPARFAIWAGAAVAFGVAFWATSGKAGTERPGWTSVVLLAVQSVAALVMYEIVCTGLETMLLVVVAAQLGLFVRLPVGALWVLSQTCLLAWLGVAHWGLVRGVGWALVMAFPTEVLAMFTSYFAASQARARHALARTNAELKATREILAESREIAERARISRELHDLLGHHLTALSLSLEAARYHSEGAARQQVERSQELTKLLLSDVREAVRSIRVQATVDMSRVLAPLIVDIVRPHVHLEVPHGLTVNDPERAQALVRCVQEIVTNSVRHARAENLWIEISEDEAGFRVVGRDDGQGSRSLRLGQGLTGMRERLGTLGGSVDYDSPTGGGFRVTALIPRPETAP